MDSPDAIALPSLGALTARLRAAGCVFAEEEAGLLLTEAVDGAALERQVSARIAGVPLEVVLGWAEFDGLRIVVEPGVFVPRQRTATLVEVAAAALGPGDVLVDLGCGTGAIAAAVRRRVPGLEVWAVDVDPAAVACARRNLPPDRVREGDLYDALPGGLRGRVAVVAANAPYVPTAALGHLPREARDHEHRVALDGGSDGLAVQRRVVAGAQAWLRDGGRVLIETGRTQGPATVRLLADAGLIGEIVRDEDPDGPGGCVAVGVVPRRAEVSRA